MTWAILNPDIQAGVTEFSESKSDRITAIMGGAVAEEALLQSLLLRFRDSSVRKKMFDPTRGRLGDFFAKINLGYLLYMYKKPAHSALLGIATIRNEFAHRLTLSSFETETKRLIGGFELLKLHTQYQRYPAPFWDGETEYPVEECNSKRQVFITNIQILLFLLMRDMHVHVPNSNVPTPLPKRPPVAVPAKES